MVSVSAVSAGQAGSYYTRDDYYTGKDGQETGGQWTGKGSESLGLSGNVTKDDFTAVLNGKDKDGNDITGQGGSEHRAAYDMTFSAPKSVSVMAEIVGDDRVQAAHDAAVQATLDHFEGRMVAARETHDGKTESVETGNIVAAKFDHHTSRADDPQTHTHCVVMNATQRSSDGEWRAVDGHSIYDSQKELGQFYNSELAKNLKDIGYDIERTGNGNFEIAGVGKDIRDEFSQRSAAIKDVVEDIRAQYPEASDAKVKEMAALATREAKHEKSIDDSRQDWIDRLEKMGHNIEELRSATQQQREPGQEPTPERTVEDYVKLATEAIHDGESAFNINHLRDVATRMSVGDHTQNDIEAAIEVAVFKGEIRQVGPEAGQDTMYSTPAMIDTEQRIVDTVIGGQGQADGIAGAGKKIEKWQEEHGMTLTDGQRAAADMILSTNDRYTGVQGDAGTGKTTMLEAVKDIATAEGQQVRGLAFTGKAAAEIEQASGIKSHTLDSFLGQADKMKIVTPEQQAENIQRYQAVLDKLGGEKALKEVKQPVTRGEKDAMGGTSSLILDTRTGFGPTPEASGESRSSSIKQETIASSIISDIKADIDKRFGSTAAGKLVSNGERTESHTYNVVHEHGGKMERAIQTVDITRSTHDPSQSVVDVHTLHANGDIYHTHIASMPDGRAMKSTEKIENPNNNVVKGKETWVVDEASMVGAKKMDALVQAAERAEAKVVLIGDEKQLAAIDAGRTFKDLQAHGMTTEKMTESIRQKDEAYKEVVKDLANRNVEGAIEKLESAGKIHHHDSRDGLRAAMVDDFMQKGEKDTIIVTARNADRRALNDEIRGKLKDQGKITDERGYTVRETKGMGPEVARTAGSYQTGDIVIARQAGIMGRAGAEGRVIGTGQHTVDVRTGDGKTHTVDVERHGGHLSTYQERQANFGIGEKVVFGKNDRGLGVKNGQTGHVSNVSEDGKMTVKMDGEKGKNVTFNTKSQYNYVSTAYAVTDFKSQGQTSKNVMFDADKDANHGGSYNQAYVAVSRGKSGVDVYTTQTAEKMRETWGYEKEKTSTLTIPEKGQEGQRQEKAPATEKGQEKGNDKGQEGQSKGSEKGQE